MTDINDLIPAFPTHPGDVLKDEMKARKLKVDQLAKKMDTNHTYLKRIIKGRTDLCGYRTETGEGAEIDAVIWLNLQQSITDLAKIGYKQECELVRQLKSKS
jgi:plasmid maintenance system antidote protein VapI